jgi:glycosyltransferase involved in cell wall biosynthesis
MKNLFVLLVKRPIGIFLRKLEEERYKRNLTRQQLNVPDKGIYLSYAGQSAHDANGILHGGRVKLIHLAEEYPESELLTNVLYLVSSAIPEHAEVLVRYLKQKGVKLVWNQNGVAYPAWDRDNYKITNTRLSSLLHMADYVVYQSEFCRLSADRYLGRVKVPNKVLYNPVDTERFIPSDNPPPFDTWQLLVTGTHLQPDRVLLILKMLAELNKRGQKAKLTIAGRLDWPDGDKETHEAITQLKLTGKVELLGAFTQDQAPGIYQAAHILFHIKYKDPCPTVPIEAMSCGVPVIGSLSGGMQELVSDEGGVLLKVPDVWDKMCYPAAEEMVEAVITIMGDLDSWRQKARHRAVSHFSKDYWLEQHRRVFTEAL